MRPSVPFAPPFVTVLGFAAITAATTLVIGWSGRTYADPPETFFESGTVDDLSFSGELAHDASYKTGWAIKVTVENRGDEDGTCTLDTELTRAQVSPGSRSSPAGVAVWHRKEKVTVTAHESVVRTYDVPQWMAAQLAANDKSAQIREKMIERENAKPMPNYALSMRPYTMYSVAFQRVDG
jgi:hypothetical protein